jgi:hypothetical protein
MAQVSGESRGSLRSFAPHTERGQTVLDAPQILELAVLHRYRSLHAFERATGLQHTLFIMMRRGVVPNLQTLTTYCRAVGVTFASVLAACWNLDLNKLPELHLLTSPDCTTILPISAAGTGMSVRLLSQSSSNAMAGGIFTLASVFDRYEDQNMPEFPYKTVRLGDWSLFPLFCPGDFLFVESSEHNLQSLERACRRPRPIVLARRASTYLLGHLERSASAGSFVLEPHPESGYPRVELRDNRWELIGFVRAYGASLRRRPVRPSAWVPKRAIVDLPDAAASRFGTMAREARTRRGFSGKDVAEAIRRLTPHLPGKPELYLLSKARIYNIERNPHDSVLNVFGLFALLAIYGLDYREAMDALGFPIDDRDCRPIQDLIGPTRTPQPLANDDHPWTTAVLKHWRALPSHLLTLCPSWSRNHVLYHGPQLAHPMALEHSFLSVDVTCNDVPERPVYDGRVGLHWPLFVLETPHGTICSNAYRAGRQVHLIPHPLQPPEERTFDLEVNVRVTGKVAGIAALLPESFGWD